MEANIRSVIETLKCPVHHRYPDVGPEGDDPVKISCCCAEFKMQCHYILTKLSDGQSIETAIGTWEKYNFTSRGE